MFSFLKRVLAALFALVSLATLSAQESSNNPQPAAPTATPGSFSIEFHPGTTLPILSGKINGVEGKFLLDLGSQYSILVPDFAKKANVTILRRDLIVKVNDSERVLSLARAQEIKLGTASFQNVMLPVMPIDQFQKGEGKLALDGIIGANELLRSAPIFRLNYATKTATLTNEAPANQTPIPAEITPAGIYINGKIHDKSFRFLLDTGASHSMINEWTGKTTPAGSWVMGSVNQTQENKVEKAEIDDLTIGNISFPKPSLFVSKAPNQPAANVLGSDFFQHSEISFEPAKNQIYLSNSTQPTTK